MSNCSKQENSKKESQSASVPAILVNCANAAQLKLVLMFLPQKDSFSISLVNDYTYTTSLAHGESTKIRKRFTIPFLIHQTDLYGQIGKSKSKGHQTLICR